MRIGPSSVPTAYAQATHLSQTTCRVAAHRSGPTERPVAPPDAVTGDTLIRRPSRHTFDIRV